MLRILRGEAFISIMAAVALMSLVELFLDQGHISSGVIYVALLFSSIGLITGLGLAATAKEKR